MSQQAVFLSEYVLQTLLFSSNRDCSIHAAHNMLLCHLCWAVSSLFVTVKGRWL